MWTYLIFTAHFSSCNTASFLVKASRLFNADSWASYQASSLLNNSLNRNSYYRFKRKLEVTVVFQKFINAKLMTVMTLVTMWKDKLIRFRSIESTLPVFACQYKKAWWYDTLVSSWANIRFARQIYRSCIRNSSHRPPFSERKFLPIMWDFWDLWSF